MTTTLSELQQVYTRRTIALLRHMLLMPSVTNRNYEGEARRGQTVKIWKYDSDDQTLGKGAADPALPSVVEHPARTTPWRAAVTPQASSQDGGSYIDLSINRTLAESWFDPHLDGPVPPRHGRTHCPVPSRLAWRARWTVTSSSRCGPASSRALGSRPS